jgi:hypothetical protein
MSAHPHADRRFAFPARVQAPAHAIIFSSRRRVVPPRPGTQIYTASALRYYCTSVRNLNLANDVEPRRNGRLECPPS